MYVSTQKLCQYYDLDQKFFFRRIDSGVFVKNVHFIQQQRTIRWDIEAIKKWWQGTDSSDDGSIDKILDKITA